MVNKLEYIIHGKSIVTMSKHGIIKNGAIVIEGEEIIDLGKYDEIKPKYSGYEVIDASNCIVLPGLINAHTHMAMSLLRGYADDLMLHEWLEKWIWPLESKMTSKDVYIGALLASIEAIKMGTTTVNTMYHYYPDYNEAKAIYETGLRGVISHVCFSWREKEDIERLDHLIRNWHGKDNWRIRAAISPHAPYTVSPEYMVKLREYANKINEKAEKDYEKAIWHIHLAETKDEAKKIEENFKVKIKGGIIEYLQILNVLKEDVIAAHCVWLTEEDIKILSKNKVKVAHNPISNLKLASGISPIEKLLKNNIVVALGTDSACSNNLLDMFETMKIAALLQKGVLLNPTAIKAEEALKMATINGAKALSWESQIGSIEKGKKADLITIELQKPHLKPLFNEVSHIVYAVRSLDVRDVIINGKIIMENHQIKTVDEEWILREVEKVKDNLLERLHEGEAK